MATKTKQLNSLANVYALNNSCWLHLKQVWKDINWNGRNLRKRNKNAQSPLSNTQNFRYYKSGTSFKSLNMSLNKVYNPITSCPTPSIHSMVLITMPAAWDSISTEMSLSSIWASSFASTLYHSTFLLQRIAKLPIDACLYSFGH